ncbi:MAG: glycosyltransferase family 39 protein [Thermomicrobiales bacterium]|nr:glycosyltransferase family 39 protein [Thermomicrobiales bacterium]
MTGKHDPTQPIAAHHSRWRAAAVLTLIASIAFGHALLRMPYAGFNPDESRWISRAHYLADILDPFGPTWDDRYATRGQPPVGSYLTGIGLLVQGRDLATNGPWDFSIPGAEGWQHNIDVGNMPVPADLSAARRFNAALVALTAIVVALIARRVAGPVAGVVAGMLFALHPFSAYIGSIATSDAGFGLSIALAALVAGRLAAHPSTGSAIVLGALLGLGGGTKLSPLVTAVLLGGYGIALLAGAALRRQPWQADRLGWALAATPFIAALAFIGSYPYLWPDPVGRTRNLVEFRTEEMRQQSADWPVMAVPNRAEALRRVGINFGERFSVLGMAGQGVAALTGHPIAPPPLELAAALAGGLIWLAAAIRAGPRSPTSLMLMLLAGQVAVTIGGMRSEFDRYHVPMALLGSVALGVAAAIVAPPIATGWRRLRSVPARKVAERESRGAPARVE